MRRIRNHLTYANVMATIAVFLVLGGGTAVAALVVSDNSQIGPGTVSGHKPPAGDHANVIGGSLGAADLAAGAVTNGKIANGAVTNAKLAGLGFLRAGTALLHDQAGGSGASQSLFTIGRVGLIAFCNNLGGGTLAGGIETAVDEAGPILVTDGEAGDPDFALRLQPFDVQFVVSLNSSSLAAQEKSFAILDDGGTSASGVAAVSVHPGSGDCRITAHAVG
ncbi:MAG: hypothetical protein ACRDLL_00715 [Solirubrobacterales bacterium]